MPKKPKSDQSTRLDGYDVRVTSTGAWEAFDRSSGEVVHLSGIALTRLTHDEALGALHLLQSGAVEPDAQKEH